MKRFMMLACLFAVSLFGGVGASIRSSGNPTLDRQIQDEVYAIAETFGVRVDLRYYKDGKSPNAQASSPARGDADGTLSIGRTLLQTIAEESRQPGATLLIVLAHEVGHIYFYRNHLPISGTAVERHADFMAGYYIGKQIDQGRNIDLEAVVETLYNMFDGPDPSHGDVKERISMVLYGLRSRGMTVDAAARRGVALIRQGAYSVLP